MTPNIQTAWHISKNIQQQVIDTARDEVTRLPHIIFMLITHTLRNSVMILCIISFSWIFDGSKVAIYKVHNFP